MENKILEEKTKNSLRPCAHCGTKYDLQARLKETKNTPKPNTALDYCSTKCWAVETSIREACRDFL